MSNHTLIYPRPTNVTSAPEFFFEYPSTLLGGTIWGDLILIAVFAISYMALSFYPAPRAFAAASFTSLVTTVLMIGLVSPPIVGGLELAVTASMTVLGLLINNNTGGGRL